MITGASVEFSDQIAGGGNHDRVEPSCPVGNPRAECILSRGGHVTDMNTTMIKIEVECLGVAVAEGERCCCFGAVGEAMQLGQVEGAVVLLDVAEDATGANRSKLLIISNQPDTRTAIDGELD